MANIDLITGFRTTFFGSFSGLKASFNQATENSFSLKSNDGLLRQEFAGSFSLTKKGRIKSGRISSFSVLIDDQIAWTVSGLDLSVSSYNQLFTLSKKEAFDGLFGGADRFDGSDQQDTLFSYAGNDIVNANSGDDVINAGIGNDTLFGGEGNDTLDGSDGEDILNGETGFDQLDGGVDADLLTGGPGADLFITREGSSPELTAIQVDQQNNQRVTFVAGNGIDIITDFDVSDAISFSDRVVSPDFIPFFFDTDVDPGDPAFLPGTWSADDLSADLNRGNFVLDQQGEDLFFFVVTPELVTLIQSQQLNDFDPSVFGDQLFVLLDASDLLA